MLNWHEHLNERFEPMNPAGDLDAKGGITQFTVGTGGGNLRRFENIKPHSTTRASEHGILMLTLESGE